MKTLNKIQSAILIIGAILVLIGAASYVTGWSGAFYCFSLGACSFSAIQLYAGYDGSNITIRRLRRQQIMGALFLLLTAVFMGMDFFNFSWGNRNEWFVSLAISCVLELYTSFRLPDEIEKEERNKQL